MPTTHSRILSRLNDLNHVSAVYLVGRTTLNFPCVGSYFFLPDFHLLSKNARRGYNFSFHHDKGWSDGGGTYREPMLEEVLGTIPDEFALLHLGDLFDTWREGLRPDEAAARIRGDYAWVEAMSARAEASGGAVFVGNHDRLDSTIADPRMQRSRLIEGHILVTHGDVFDGLEDAPDWLSAAAVASPVGKLFGSREINLTHSKLVQSETDVVPLTNNSHELAPAIAHFLGELRQGNAAACQRLGLPTRAHDIRAVVIGHTHHARLVWSGGAQALIFDCGAWIERCLTTAGYPPEPSAQVGVIAPTASGTATDFRIYQLTVR